MGGLGANHPRVTNVTGSEYSTGSTSDATSPVYDDDIEFCSLFGYESSLNG